MDRLELAAAVVFAVAFAACAAVRSANKPLPMQDPGIRFSSDLGPNSIDVSSYPAAQKRNYQLYAKTCSRCHLLARSINSPIVSREFWNMYVQAMRRRSEYASVSAISREDAKAIVDFLDYDAKARKLAHKKEFDAQSAELERRFDAMMEGQPLLLPQHP